MSTNATWSAPTSSGERPARLTSNLEATASSWRTWPNVKDRKNVPNVEGARPAVSTRPIPPWRSRSMASMLSAPATIPATSAPTFTTGFDPPDPGTRTWARARSCNPARSAKAMTGTKPAHDTRFGSSKLAERLWQTRIYRMSSSLVRWNPQQVPSSQVKRTFVRHDPPTPPPSPVDPGSADLAEGERPGIAPDAIARVQSVDRGDVLRPQGHGGAEPGAAGNVAPGSAPPWPWAPGSPVPSTGSDSPSSTLPSCRGSFSGSG